VAEPVGADCAAGERRVGESALHPKMRIKDRVFVLKSKRRVE